MSKIGTSAKVTIPTLRAVAGRAEPITMVVAYDFPSGRLADEAGLEIVLVGDSLAMTMLGQPDTLSVTMDEMLVFARSAGPARHGDRRSALRLVHRRRGGRGAQRPALHEGCPDRRGQAGGGARASRPSCGAWRAPASPSWATSA